MNYQEPIDSAWIFGAVKPAVQGSARLWSETWGSGATALAPTRRGFPGAGGRGEKPEARAGARASEVEADDGLLSHDLAIAVPSALQGLTTVFGMGTGVAPAR